MQSTRGQLDNIDLLFSIVITVYNIYFRYSSVVLPWIIFMYLMLILYHSVVIRREKRGGETVRTEWANKQGSNGKTGVYTI